MNSEVAELHEFLFPSTINEQSTLFLTLKYMSKTHLQRNKTISNTIFSYGSQNIRSNIWVHYTMIFKWNTDFSLNYIHHLQCLFNFLHLQNNQQTTNMVPFVIRRPKCQKHRSFDLSNEQTLFFKRLMFIYQPKYWNYIFSNVVFPVNRIRSLFTRNNTVEEK